MAPLGLIRRGISHTLDRVGVQTDARTARDVIVMDMVRSDSRKPHTRKGLAAMDKAFAERFAAEWIDAWNAHDLTRVLAHYTDDFAMSSPIIVEIAGEPSGTLRGKESIRAYWAAALGLIPDLHFELISVLVGVRSVALHYRGARNRLVVEVLHFGPDDKVASAFAHYAI